MRLCGTTDPAKLSRPKIARKLREKPELATLIESCRVDDLFGGTIWKVDVARAKNVVLKLARAHLAHELSLPKLGAPEIIEFRPRLPCWRARRPCLKRRPRTE